MPKSIYLLFIRHSGNNIEYTVNVRTGEIANGSSDAKPFIHLYGNNGDTGKKSSKKQSFIENENNHAVLIVDRLSVK